MKPRTIHHNHHRRSTKSPDGCLWRSKSKTELSVPRNLEIVVAVWRPYVIFLYLKVKKYILTLSLRTVHPILIQSFLFSTLIQESWCFSSTMLTVGDEQTRAQHGHTRLSASQAQYGQHLTLTVKHPLLKENHIFLPWPTTLVGPL